MGRRKVDELREKSVEELIRMLNDINEEYMKFVKLIRSGGAPEKPGKVKAMKKMRARILTILSEKGVKL